jgi:hypothetical protein
MNTDLDKALGEKSRFGRIAAYLLMIACLTLVVDLLCDPG